MARDPYSVLGVDKKASQDEIKKAYRRLARRHHPDRNPDDPKAEARFKDVQGAYDTISDPAKRKQFDRGGMFGGFGGGGGRGGSGQGGGQWAGAGPGGIRVFNFDSRGLGDIGDVLAGLFGGARMSQPQPQLQPQRGRDLRAEVRLSADQAASGAKVAVTVPGVQGHGQDQGQGSRGQVGRAKRYRVTIPAGVKDGGRVKVKGKGRPGLNGGPPGDLYVVTRVKGPAKKPAPVKEGSS